MIPLRALFVCVALCACAAPSAPTPATAPELPPLATEEQIAAAETTPLDPDAASWASPFEPFNLIGNIHYVGTGDVASYLITTPEGHFLLDGGAPQAGPMVIAHIAALGFDIQDVKYVLNTHAHFDHAGGLARLQRASGAVMVASEGDRGALEAGRVGYGPSADWLFPPVRVDRVIGDGETVTLGGVALTAHLTTGHTRGCTSWSMDVRGANGAPHRAFFHCSATVAGHSLVPPAYPGIVENYRAMFAQVRGFEADVFLGNHAGFYDLSAKRERQIAGDANAFVDAGELQRFNTYMENAFETELARQTAAAN
jgi:metallo-beta-lactamase class B